MCVCLCVCARVGIGVEGREEGAGQMESLGYIGRRHSSKWAFMLKTSGVSVVGLKTGVI